MNAPASLVEAWSTTLAEAPSAIALIDAASGRQWTRAELDAAADRWAGEHRALVEGQLVSVAEPNSAEWFAVFLGLLRCNAVIAPLDAGEPHAAQKVTATSIGAPLLWRTGTLEELSAKQRPKRDGRRLVKLTSGSTGTPRPLFFTDSEMIADGRQICAAMRIRADDVNVGLIPWGHSYGLGNLVMPLILQGTAIVFGAVPLPHAVASLVEKWKPTVFPGVPALFRALVDSTVMPAQLASLRTVISAGAALAPEIARAFQEKFERKIHSFYGSSETGGISFDPTGESAALGRGVGLPIPGVTIGSSRGGRFTVSSAAVYTIGNRRKGSHLMADIGRLSETGELVLVGRAGRFVKIAGRRLNLAEVEQALKAVTGVRDALVTSHAERADALAAAVASERSGAEIRDALRERLAPWKIPKKILTLPSFPLTSRGKTDARQIRAMLEQP